MSRDIKIITDKKKAAQLKKKMALYKESMDKVASKTPFEKIFKILLESSKSKNYVIEHLKRHLDPIQYKSIVNLLNKSQEIDKQIEIEISKFNKDYQRSIIQLGKLETELAKEVEEAKETKEVK